MEQTDLVITWTDLSILGAMGTSDQQTEHGGNWGPASNLKLS
jgi:hypothetical protein